MNPIITQDEPRADAAPYHWTVDRFYRALDAGVFDQPERIELIGGALTVKMGQNPARASLISRLTRLLRAYLEPRFTVREEKPLHIADDAEPVPDIIVVVGSELDYEQRRPTPSEVRLLVEVADSSTACDTQNKAMLYSQSGVTEYWVVLLPSHELVVFRQPAPDGYRSTSRLSADDSIAPVDAPGVALTIRQIFSR